MSRTNCTLALCVLAVALTSGSVAAQQTPPPKPAAKVEQKTESSVWDQTSGTTATGNPAKRNSKRPKAGASSPAA